MRKYSIVLFFNNLRYLFRFNIKDMARNGVTKEYVLAAAQRSEWRTKNAPQSIAAPHIKTKQETIEELIHTQKSIIRFGDGEFFLIWGHSIPFQKHNKLLSESLKEILLSQDERLLIGLPGGYWYGREDLKDKVSRDWLCNHTLKHHFDYSAYFLESQVYANTGLLGFMSGLSKEECERHYAMCREIWADKEVVVICGDKVHQGITHLLVDNAKSVEFVDAPTMNAYENIHTLREQISQFNHHKLLLFAIGPAGKVLAYEFFKRGYRVLDIGHLLQDYDLYKKGIQRNETNILTFYKPDDKDKIYI